MEVEISRIYERERQLNTYIYEIYNIRCNDFVVLYYETDRRIVV